MNESLTIHEGPATGITSLLQRAVGLNRHAYARLQQVEDYVNVYVTTPFNVVASRRVKGKASRDGAVILATDLLERGEGKPHDASWAGSLPPATGFKLIDEIPVGIASDLAEKGRSLARQFSGPMGPPASLLDQKVMVVSSAEKSVDISMRMIFACTSLGFIPQATAPAHIPRYLRVSSAGRWVRVDAPYGTVYESTGLSLLL
ncbi:hypothetical protein LJU02_08110 [Corynebacterium pseudotuberculosis]|uniref:Uncharacterized protein n=1 Tax=Corynebacterium pseudotuberculosis (strain C231) TaxID=681645 RepID=D9QBZ9_CORP2|nr:hypothetical protein [Corynebacterium pseudotuberculosis]ADK29411.1 hypothetical protein CPFRC_08120 [Corynebacterium pseudotuberculosis FRC41]ADL11075.1 hypothetical protein CPC231_08120 [Corynebacterium pseudotuberculosis C231]ADL21481.1 hypothetical protein CP1002_05025 [Corynebacterium pseudotuberculosis 1002]ADO26876.1 hypothetical protein CPI19_03400 [Corynebacterium pseudotuberculosis I19]AEK92940.1 Hypothetical protein CpPAT10_1613 [Corynebacterium pseudotuberculosis PAT10]